ncbi:CLTA family protein [Megaselia abdita]
MDFETNFEEDPAAEFLAREQSALAGLEVDDFGASENQLVDSLKPESPTESFEMVPTDTENPPPVRVEPEKIKKWREEQKLRLEEKDKQEELKKQELLQQAKAELADWLKQTEEAIAKTKAASRSAEKEEIFESDDSEKSGNDWEKIAKLCEFNPKTSKSGKDVSRMRSIILQLKQNPIAIKTSN